MKKLMRLSAIVVICMCAYEAVLVQSVPKEDNLKCSFFDLSESAREKAANKDYEKSLEFYDLAVQKEPNNPEGYLNRGVILSLLNQKIKAIADEQKALSLIKSNDKYDIVYSSYAHKNLAGMYLNNAELDKAESEARIAIKLSPNDGEAHAKLGDILKKKGQFKESLVEINKAKDLHE